MGHIKEQEFLFTSVNLATKIYSPLKFYCLSSKCS